MAATIIFPEHARWYAPLAWYQQLAALLPDGVLVNAGGEVVDRDPTEVARIVSAGGRWVDYCGYPMWYREYRLAYPVHGEEAPLWRLGTMGFSQFLMAMDMLFSHTFMPSGFTFPRSLVVREAKVPAFVIPNLQTPHTENTFSCFALKHPGGGMYFYAYASPDGTGVEPRAYGGFINSLLKAPMPPPIPDGRPPVPPIPPWALPLGAALGAAALLAYALSQR